MGYQHVMPWSVGTKSSYGVQNSNIEHRTDRCADRQQNVTLRRTNLETLDDLETPVSIQEHTVSSAN